MFNYIGGTFFSFVDAYVNSISAALSLALIGVVTAALTVYYLFVGYAVMRGEVHAPLVTIVWKSVKMNLILYIALSAGVYQTFVVVNVGDVTAQAMTSISNASSASAGATVCVPAGTGTPAVLSVIDCNFEKLLVPYDSIKTAAKGIDWYDVPSALSLEVSSGLYSLCLMVLVLAVAYTLFTTQLTLSLVLAVGPLFIAALAFEPTKSYFEGWKNKIVYVLILNLFIVIFLGLVFIIVNGYIIHLGFNVDRSADFIGVQQVEAIKSVLKLAAIMVLFGYMFTKLDNIAHSLVGGGDNSGGLGLMLATAALGRQAWRALSSNVGSGGGTGAGGTIAPAGGGFSGALGRGLQAAGQGAGAGALAIGQGMGAGALTVGQGTRSIARHVAHQISTRMRQ